MEFLKVDSVETARERLLSNAGDWLAARETVPIREACGRILAEDLFAREDIPSFRRSTVDGYAVISEDTAAAGEGAPVFLAVKGRVDIGASTSIEINRGECAEIPTGGMAPNGADAVAMIEYAEPSGGGIALCRRASFGENVVQTGEDAAAGDLLLRQGRRLLPQDVGAMAAAGFTFAPVFASPRVTILSTGDELVPPSDRPLPGQVRDVNTCALTALAGRAGFSVVFNDVLPDGEGVLERAVREAMETSDIVAVSGGSSQGEKDVTKSVLSRASSPGVHTHGLALKPGKPTILGYDSPTRTILAGLPGHPVSAMIVFEMLLCWLLREITGCPPAPAIPARVSVNTPSSPGRTTCWPAKLNWTGSEYTAEPIFGKSGMITTLTKADGYFIVERDTEGLQAGRDVLVHLF